VMSGIPSPTLGKNIAMCYVHGHHKKNTALAVEVRKRMRSAVVTPMPFVPAKYYRGQLEYQRRIAEGEQLRVMFLSVRGLIQLVALELAQERREDDAPVGV